MVGSPVHAPATTQFRRLVDANRLRVPLPGLTPHEAEEPTVAGPSGGDLGI